MTMFGNFVPFFVSFFLLSSCKGSKIVGGDLAKEGQFPYQVSLQLEGTNSHFCGGSIYNSRAVITAAHCCEFAEENDLKIRVVAGILHLIYDSEYQQNLDVESMIIHPEYTTIKSVPVNDICILILDGTFTFNDYKNIAPIGIDVNQTCNIGDSCLISGWGATREESKIVSNNLLFAEVNLLSDQNCDVYNQEMTYMPEVMVCAGDSTFSKDTCQGDSGGPLMCGKQLCGVVSFGYGCAHKPYHGVYTEVAHFADWIMKNGSKMTLSSQIHLFFLLTIGILINKL